MNPAPFPGMVFAGGLSRRMGSNKCLETVGDKRLIDHAIARLSPQVSGVWISTGPDRPPEWAAATGLPMISDGISGHAGPLAGLLAGLRHAISHSPETDRLLTIPADTPFFPHDLATRLSAASTPPGSIVVACSFGRMHPVFALWPVSITEDLAGWLSDEGNRRIQAFLHRHPVVSVDFPPETDDAALSDPFFNVNTPQDLEKARQVVKTIQTRRNNRTEG